VGVIVGVAVTALDGATDDTGTTVVGLEVEAVGEAGVVVMVRVDCELVVRAAPLDGGVSASGVWLMSAVINATANTLFCPRFRKSRRAIVAQSILPGGMRVELSNVTCDRHSSHFPYSDPS
jgi:hypothetical protein